MSKSLPSLLVILFAQASQAQYFDNLNDVNPTGAAGVSYTWSDPILGNVTASWTGTLIRASSNNFFPSTGERTTGSIGFYDIAVADSSSNDTELTFAWDAPVTIFDFTIGDWDGGGSVVETLTFTGVDEVSLLSVGSIPPPDHQYLAPGNNTLTYTRDGGSSGLSNGLVANGLRVRLENGGNSFNQFTISGATATRSSSDFILIGGPTPTPEPSSALLAVMGTLLGISRRTR